MKFKTKGIIALSILGIALIVGSILISISFIMMNENQGVFLGSNIYDGATLFPFFLGLVLLMSGIPFYLFKKKEFKHQKLFVGFKIFLTVFAVGGVVFMGMSIIDWSTSYAIKIDFGGPASNEEIYVREVKDAYFSGDQVTILFYEKEEDGRVEFLAMVATKSEYGIFKNGDYESSWVGNKLKIEYFSLDETIRYEIYLDYINQRLVFWEYEEIELTT